MSWGCSPPPWQGPAHHSSTEPFTFSQSLCRKEHQEGSAPPLSYSKTCLQAACARTPVSARSPRSACSPLVPTPSPATMQPGGMYSYLSLTSAGVASDLPFVMLCGNKEGLRRMGKPDTRLALLSAISNQWQQSLGQGVLQSAGSSAECRRTGTRKVGGCSMSCSQPRGMEEALPFQGSRSSPGDGGEACAILVHEVSPCVEHPAVVQGHQGVPCRGGVVLAVLAVCILQWRELILTQNLIHHKLPGEKNRTWRVGSALGASQGHIPTVAQGQTAIL